MKLQALIFFATVAAAPIASLAQPGLLPQKETETIVLQFQAAYADTFNRRDAVRMGALFTENATLQNEWGDVTQGRAISHRVVPGAELAQMFLTRILVRQAGQWKPAATQIARPSIAPKPGTVAPAKLYIDVQNATP